MAKNHDKLQETPQAPEAAPLQPAPARPPVSNAAIWTFWGGVALALIVARVLNHLLPGISESIIERWVMLAFGVFLAGFLIKLR